MSKKNKVKQTSNKRNQGNKKGVASGPRSMSSRNIAPAPRKPSDRPLAERLGLERLERLTATNCRIRAAFLRAQIEAGSYDYDKTLLQKAKKHAAWYAAKAKQLK